MAWPKGKPRAGHIPAKPRPAPKNPRGPRKPKKETPTQIEEPNHKEIVRIVDHWYPYSKGARSRFLRHDGRYVDRQWNETGTSSTWWLMPLDERERTDVES